MASQELQTFDHWQFTDINLTQHPHSQSIILIVTIVTVLFLAAFIYLYHHYVLDHSTPLITTITPTNFTAISLPGNAVQGIPVGLDSATINAIPIFLHPLTPNLADDEMECSICLGFYLDDEIIKVLPKCHHAYHSACVDKWLITRSSCPLCRASLEVVSSSESVVLHL